MKLNYPEVNCFDAIVRDTAGMLPFGECMYIGQIIFAKLLQKYFITTIYVFFRPEVLPYTFCEKVESIYGGVSV